MYSRRRRWHAAARLAFCPTTDGFLTSTQFETVINLHADYTFRFGGSQRLVLMADAFNLFNNRNPLWYDTNLEIGFQSLNPNYGQASNGGGSSAPGYRRPVQIRWGARFEW